MEVVSKINKMIPVFHKQRNIKKCHFCGSGKHILNNFEIRYMMEINQCLGMTVNVHSNHQHTEDKG